MSLYKQIQDEIKACMKSGEKQKLSVLRMVLTEMKYEQAKTDISKDLDDCLLYTSPSPRDRQKSRMPSSA